MIETLDFTRKVCLILTLCVAILALGISTGLRELGKGISKIEENSVKTQYGIHLIEQAKAKAAFERMRAERPPQRSPKA